MPTTRPLASYSGPPESPDLIGASVTMMSCSRSEFVPVSSDAVIERCSAVTLPDADDGVPPVPPALPTPTTLSATRHVSGVAEVGDGQPGRVDQLDQRDVLASARCRRPWPRRSCRSRRSGPGSTSSPRSRGCWSGSRRRSSARCRCRRRPPSCTSARCRCRRRRPAAPRSPCRTAVPDEPDEPPDGNGNVPLPGVVLLPPEFGPPVSDEPVLDGRRRTATPLVVRGRRPTAMTISDATRAAASTTTAPMRPREWRAVGARRRRRVRRSHSRTASARRMRVGRIPGLRRRRASGAACTNRSPDGRP